MSWRAALVLAGAGRRAELRSELFAELARPADSGEPWPEALAEAAAEHPDAALRSALGEIAARLREGRTPSESLEGMEALTGPEARPALAAAERAGGEAVGEALRELERSVLRAQGDAARLREAWLVPAVTMAYALGVLGLLGLSVGPVLPELAGGRPPLALRLLPVLDLGTGRWLTIWAVACVAGAMLPCLVMQLPAGRALVDRLPVWAPLRRSALGLLAARSIARLLEAGTGLDEALRAAAQVLPRGRARDELAEAAERAAAGEPAVAIFAEPRDGLPPVLRAVLAAADGDSGLAEGLRRLAGFEEAELERAAARAATASAVCGLLVSGAFAAFVVIAGWSAYFQSIGSSPF